MPRRPTLLTTFPNFGRSRPAFFVLPALGGATRWPFLCFCRALHRPTLLTTCPNSGLPRPASFALPALGGVTLRPPPSSATTSFACDYWRGSGSFRGAFASTCGFSGLGHAPTQPPGAALCGRSPCARAAMASVRRMVATRAPYSPSVAVLCPGQTQRARGATRQTPLQNHLRLIHRDCCPSLTRRQAGQLSRGSVCPQPPQWRVSTQSWTLCAAT